MDEYQSEAVKFMNPALSVGDRVVNCALGLAGEVGEVIEPIKKHLFHGKPLFKDDLEKEIGDVLWYVANLCEALGLDMSVVAEKNIHKLSARWPDGFKVKEVEA